MISNKVITVFLIIAGLIGLSVGVGLAFFPDATHAQYGIFISGNVSQLSETRATGMSISIISIIILIGAFMVRLRYTALVLSTVVFLSYGIGRLFSLAIDGIPSQGLLVAMVIELLIGVIAFLVLRGLKSLIPIK